MTKLGGTESIIVDDNWKTIKQKFTVPKNGTYNIGLQAYNKTEKGNVSVGYFRNLKLTTSTNIPDDFGKADVDVEIDKPIETAPPAPTTASNLWKLHEGKGNVTLSKELDGDDDASVYDYMAVPANNDSKWATAPVDTKGNASIETNGTGSIKTDDCLNVDFTYLQRELLLPKAEYDKVDKVFVSFDLVENGARVYVFNSKNPTGANKKRKRLIHGENTASANLLSLLIPDEVNRIVVVQYDSCADGKAIKGARLVVDTTTNKN